MNAVRHHDNKTETNGNNILWFVILKIQTHKLRIPHTFVTFAPNKTISNK